MDRFFIVSNAERDVNLEFSGAIERYIEQKGGKSKRYVSTKSTWNERNLRHMRREDIDSDCIIVVGGDGTLVRAARDVSGTEIPLIGVNLGRIGYLCELEKSTVFDAVDKLFEGEYEIEKRMMIDGESVLSGGGGETVCALNDIVIHRSGMPQIIDLMVFVNGEYLTTYSADGIIISTPTGSTGYSLSGGGPIVDPKASLILITPINSHAGSGRSIVVGADARVEVTLSRRRDEMDEEAEAIFDGDFFLRMKVGDTMRIRRADVHANILKLNQLSFLQILRKKMRGSE